MSTLQTIDVMILLITFLAAGATIIHFIYEDKISKKKNKRYQQTKQPDQTVYFSDFKETLAIAIKKAEGLPVAVKKQGRKLPYFYCISPKMYALLVEKLDEKNKQAKSG